jgi:hypothetical protein
MISFFRQPPAIHAARDWVSISNNPRNLKDCDTSGYQSNARIVAVTSGSDVLNKLTAEADKDAWKPVINPEAATPTMKERNQLCRYL